jgi:hypothetical protein
MRTMKMIFYHQLSTKFDSLPNYSLVVYPNNITMFDNLLDGLQSAQALSEI